MSNPEIKTSVLLGVKHSFVEGFDMNAPINEAPAELWNQLAQCYAKHHIGLEIRFVMFNPEHELPIVRECRRGIFIAKAIESDRRLKESGVHAIRGSVHDGHTVRHDVVLRWSPTTLAWREKTRYPIAPEVREKLSREDLLKAEAMPPFYLEAIQGNVKTTTTLDVDAVARGEVLVPPLFEWNRPDAPKDVDTGRVWAIPPPGAVKIGESETVKFDGEMKVVTRPK